MSLLPASAVRFRDYERLFLDDNQNTGYLNPIFGFKSDTALITLEPDQFTYFHYPQHAATISLSDSTLVNDGAVPGLAPYAADKIWKKMANYSSSSIWGNADPSHNQTGEWLCAWLSGNPMTPDVKPVWMDRWYNPGYMDYSGAYFVANPVSGVIIDVPSQMTLEPKCYYKYLHLGSQANQKIVGTLSADNALRFYIENWSEQPEDLSEFGNKTQFINYAVSSVQNSVNPEKDHLDTSVYFSGDRQYCESLYNASYVLSSEFTNMFWLKVSDWNNVIGNSIVDKGFRGGWRSLYNNGFNNPFMVIAEWGTPDIGFITVDGKLLDTKIISESCQIADIAIDSEWFTWVLDNGGKMLYKLDYNGNTIDRVELLSASEYTCVDMDSAENLWVMDTTSSIISCLNTESLLWDSTITALSSDTYFSFHEVSGLISTSAVNDFVVDSDGYYWTIIDSNILCKLDVSAVMLSSTIRTSKADSIGLTREYINGQDRDVVNVTCADDQKIVKYLSDGTYHKQIDTSKFFIKPNLTKFTSYEWNRKFNYLHYNRIPQIQYEFHTEDIDTQERKRHTMSLPVTGFKSEEWYLFTHVHNTSSVEWYVNSMLVASTSIDPNEKIRYQYYQPMYIGCNAGRSRALGMETTMTNMFFRGNIDSVRIYSKPLRLIDIFYIHLDKYGYYPIKWNCDCGERFLLEEVQRFFKFKTPGMKSTYFNMRIIGLKIEDESIQDLIKDIIARTSKRLIPMYANNLQVTFENPDDEGEK